MKVKVRAHKEHKKKLPDRPYRKVSGDYKLKPVLNAKYKKKGIKYAKTARNAVQNVQLKRLEQMSFEEVIRCSAKQAQQLLRDAGVFNNKDTAFFCWQCQEQMVPTSDSNVLRCPNAQCSKRPRLHQPEFVFTPLARTGVSTCDINMLLFYLFCEDVVMMILFPVSHDMCAGKAGATAHDMDYQTLLRSAYCLGCKLPLDASVHFCRRQTETYRACEHRVGFFQSMMKVALAYSEVAHANSTKFKREVVEPDSGRMGRKRFSDKDRKKKEHHGRTLVLKGRSSKQWVAFALRPRVTKVGRGMGAEKREEVEGVLRKTITKTCVLAPDGAKAWKGVASDMNVPLAGGVNHMRKIFTPPAKFLKSKLTASQKATFDKDARGNHPSASSSPRYYTLAAGDNAAEATLGIIKQSMRRMQMVGRCNASKAELRSVQALAGAALARRAGLQIVLESLAAYRYALVTGELQTSPMDCYKAEKLPWLYTTDP